MGDQKRDIAMNKMIKTLERLDRQYRGPERVEPLLDQVKRIYPDNWQDVLMEMRREGTDPDYVSRRKAEVERLTAAFYVEVPVWKRISINETTWVNRRLREWIKQEMASWQDPNEQEADQTPKTPV
jgi:hypothetical protein